MKIGIITMHKVLNYGSALQAYATQYVIESFGYKCELIDYQYGNKKEKKRSLKNRIIGFLINILLGSSYSKKRKKFQQFYDDYFKLSNNRYETKESIENNPPSYDIYCTGSDQVWNPRFVGDDSTFMLGFVKNNAPKISYASSFATKTIPSELKELYGKYLSEYSHISVREHSNVSIIKELTGKDSSVVCDPTILLSDKDWNYVLNLKRKTQKKKYILVYILSYMYNPYPDIYKIINHVKKTLGYQVIYLGGRIMDSFHINDKCIRSAGPTDFVELFKNASFVITDSFHGSAFASIYGVPMLGVIKSMDSADGRIPTLLKEVDAEKSIISYNKKINYSKDELLSCKCNQEKLKDYRNNSKNILYRIIKSIDE